MDPTRRDKRGAGGNRSSSLPALPKRSRNKPDGGGKGKPEFFDRLDPSSLLTMPSAFDDTFDREQVPWAQQVAHQQTEETGDSSSSEEEGLPNLTTRSHATFGMRMSRVPFHERLRASIDPANEKKLARLGNALISTTLMKQRK